MRVVVTLAFLLSACAPTYETATLSTLAPRSRVLLRDSVATTPTPTDAPATAAPLQGGASSSSTRVKARWIEVRHPEVRDDSLYSANRLPIAVADIARVQAEHRATSRDVLGAVAGVLGGLMVAAAINNAWK